MESVYTHFSHKYFLICLVVQCMRMQTQCNVIVIIVVIVIVVLHRLHAQHDTFTLPVVS